MDEMTSDTGTSKRLILKDAEIGSEDLSIDILHREEKLRAIEAAITSFAENAKPDNLFIYGKTGIGKTTCVRYLLSKIKGSSTVPVYVGCGGCQTKTAILNKIAGKLDNAFSIRGFAGYEIFMKIIGLLETERKRVLLVLDDVGVLLNNGGMDIFYAVIEANRKMPGSFAMLALSDHFSTFERFDAKIKSSLMFSVLEFEPYTRDKIRMILELVCNQTLEKNCCPEEVLDKVAELGELTDGNARFAIGLLMKAAASAEQRNSDSICIEDVTKVYENLLPLVSSATSTDYPGISPDELLIIEILKSGERTSSEIYDFFLMKKDISKRQVRNYLVSLVKKGYIEAEVIESENSMLKPKMFRLKKR